MSTQSGSAWDDLNAGQSILDETRGLKSAYSGVNDINSLKNLFGVTDIKQTYQPLFRMLSANRNREMAGAALRAGRSASPEMTFSGAEGNYENGLNALMGQQGQAETQQNQWLASLLSSIFGAKDQFALNKNALAGNMAGSNFRNRLGLDEFNIANRKPTFGDIFGSVLGAGAKVAGSALGAPKINTFNFGKV